MKTFWNAIIIILIGSTIGLIVNTIRNNVSADGLPLKTPWPDNRTVDTLATTPPSYQQGDSLLTLEDAYGLYLDGKAVFLDARDPEDYKAGHIKGAINFPFEKWDAYWDKIKPQIDSNKEIVAYCGGLDCELSLFLARELKQQGYPKSYIFFGGWLRWQKAGLPAVTG
jgi:rhodanese-related sulfurtransferase